MPRNPEMPPTTPPPGDDYANEDTVDEILAGDDAARLAGLRAHFLKEGVGEKTFELGMQAQHLRKKLHDEADRELEKRLETNPNPSAEEYAMGAFIEIIEPQVRDAVLTLRRKGYNTQGSGFWGPISQSVYGDKDFLKEVPAEVREKLAQEGVTVEDDKAYFDCNEIDFEKIKKKWDEIAAALPDLGHAAPDSKFAKTFQADVKRGRYKLPEAWRSMWDKE